MFLHSFKYSLMVLLKNRQLVFWTLAFPLIMAVLFNMAFSNIENTDSFDALEIAVVNDKNFRSNLIFKEALSQLSEGEDKVFNINYTDAENAENMLRDSKIVGYISFPDKKNAKVTVRSTGTNETILCYIVDEIKSDSELIMSIGSEDITEKIVKGDFDIDYEKYYRDAADKVLNTEINVKDNSSSNMDNIMIEYYSLIAMACLYSSLISMSLINDKLANINAVGKRTSVSPATKGSMILGSLAAGFVVQAIGLAALFALMIFVISVDFGNNAGLAALLSLCGTIAGLSMGIAVATLVKKGENVKLTILISVTMTGCFLAGMMGVGPKYLIDTSVPLLNKINPVAMITDGFYALYYYNTLERYWFDVISLVVFSVLMLLISIRGLRRQQYDSI